MTDLFVNGDLDLPESVTVVHADAGAVSSFLCWFLSDGWRRFRQWVRRQ